MMTNLDRYFSDSIQSDKILKNHSKISRSGIFAFFSAAFLTLIATFFAEQYEREHHDNLFMQDAAHKQVLILQNLKSSIDAFQSFNDFYLSNETLSSKVAARFVEPLLERIPAIETLEWVPFVSAEERTSFVELARQNGLQSFQISQYGSNGNLIAATDRKEYFPIYFISRPMKSYMEEGFDLGTEPMIRDLLFRARDAGTLISTRLIRLDQGSENLNIILLIKPVYKTGLPTASLKNRRDNLRGFSIGAFAIDRLVEFNPDAPSHFPLVASFVQHMLKVYVFNRLNVGTSELIYPPMESDIATGALQMDRCIDLDTEVGDRSWLFRVCETQQHNWWDISPKAVLFFTTGLIFSLLLGFYAHRISHRRLNIEIAASNLKAEIIERNILEARKAELEIELRHAQKLEAVGQLAGGIAHEINTPIQYIGDNVRFLQQSISELQPLLHLAITGNDEKISEAAKNIDLDYLLEEMPLAAKQSLDGLMQVARIVKAMKNFAHPGTDEKIQMNLNDALLDTLTVCRNEWKHMAKVELNLANNLPLLFCHTGQLNQVFLNLIMNSVHAIAAKFKAGELGMISIQTFAEDNCVKTCIVDNGCGIETDILDRVFDPFFTTKDVGEGTGQGLAIVHDIVVKKHKGKVFVTSTPGEGTTFTVTLPLPEEVKE